MPTGPPQNVEIQSISATSVSIAWSTPKFDMQNGDIFAFVIFIVGEKAHHKQTINSTESYISGVTLSSLEPFSQYNLSIAAVNVNGSGPYSSPLPFETAHAGMLSNKINVVEMVTFFLSQHRVRHQWD